MAEKTPLGGSLRYGRADVRQKVSDLVADSSGRLVSHPLGPLLISVAPVGDGFWARLGSLLDDRSHL